MFHHDLYSTHLWLVQHHEIAKKKNCFFFQCVIRGSHICALLIITLQGLQGGLTFVVLSLSAPLHHRCSVVRIK